MKIKFKARKRLMESDYISLLRQVKIGALQLIIILGFLKKISAFTVLLEIIQYKIRKVSNLCRLSLNMPLNFYSIWGQNSLGFKLRLEFDLSRTQKCSHHRQFSVPNTCSVITDHNQQLNSDLHVPKMFFFKTHSSTEIQITCHIPEFWRVRFIYFQFNQSVFLWTNSL